MRCTTCGRDDGLRRHGRVLECTHCGAVTVAAGPAVEPRGDPRDEDGEEASRLAQIHERALAERAAKEAAESLKAGEARSPCVPCWAALAGMALLVAAGTLLFLLDGRSTRSASAGSDARDLRWHAEQGDVGSQLAVGLLYQYGFDGAAVDPALAEQWYRKSAQAGDINAQYHLGVWYGSAAVPPNAQESFHWLMLAADRGHAGAQTLVADEYRFGHRRERDLQRAAEWYGKAADQGNLDALCSLARLNGGAEGFPQDQIAASMYEVLAEGLGRQCPLGAGVVEAPDWAKVAGARRAKEKLAQGYGKAVKR